MPHWLARKKTLTPKASGEGLCGVRLWVDLAWGVCRGTCSYTVPTGREGSCKLLLGRTHLLSTSWCVCYINDWSPQIMGISAEHRSGFFPLPVFLYLLVLLTYMTVCAEHQASCSHLFLPALLQASWDVETEYLFLFPCKHQFLTCRVIGLSE